MVESFLLQPDVSLFTDGLYRNGHLSLLKSFLRLETLMSHPFFCLISCLFGCLYLPVSLILDVFVGLVHRCTYLSMTVLYTLLPFLKTHCFAFPVPLSFRASTFLVPDLQHISCHLSFCCRILFFCINNVRKLLVFCMI